MVRISEEHLRALAARGQVSASEADRVLGRRPIADVTPSVKPSKYHAIRTEVDGITFDSKREAGRYLELKLAERVGRVRNLRHQIAHPLVVNGTNCGSYVADFVYQEFLGGEWRDVVEDVKSKPTMTPVYKLKRKLMLALHGIEIRETA